MSTTDTRAAFEAWAQSPEGGRWEFESFARFEEGPKAGRYTNSRLDGEWQAYKAATEAAKPEQEGDIPPPRYSYSADGKTVTLENYDDMMEGLRRYRAEAAKATGTAGEQDEHQKFIDSLDDEDKMFEQIDRWARESYLRHKSSIRGQQITYADSERAHVILAALRWAEQEAARQPAPVTMPPAAWAAESTTGGAVRMLTKISLLESEVDRYVNREDMARIGCDRVKVPLYRAAPLVDYSVLHEWANAKGVSYNELCAVVRAATNRSQP